MGIERTAFFSAWDRGRVLINPTPIIGRAIFVDSVNGSDSLNGGSSWDDAYATVDTAIDLATANSGDKIYLAPWHTEGEAETDAVIWTMDKAGVDLIGIRQGTTMPEFTFTDDGATATISAANCRLSNVKLTSAVIDLAIGLTVTADAGGLVIDNCVFRDGAAALELVIAVNIAAACDEVTIEDCVFSTFAAGGCANAIVFAGASTNSLIKNCIATGTYSAGTFLATSACVNMQLIGNTFNNQGAIAVDLNAASTGLLADNYLAGTTSIAAALTDYDAMRMFENYVSGQDALSGLLTPGNA